MDINLSIKDVDGVSSDEEEVFESVDEGEEGLKSLNLLFVVMLFGVRFLNFMLEVVVDMFCNIQFFLDDSISLEIKQVEREVGEVVEIVVQKIRDMDVYF